MKQIGKKCTTIQKWRNACRDGSRLNISGCIGSLRLKVSGFRVCSGAMQHDAQERRDFPAVGDWVALEKMPGEERGIIHAILPENSLFSRKAAGSTIVGTDHRSKRRHRLSRHVDEQGFQLQTTRTVSRCRI